MSCVPCGSRVRRMLCRVSAGPAEAAAAGRVEPAPLGHPAPTGVSSRARYLLPSHSGRAAGCVLGDPLHS